MKRLLSMMVATMVFGCGPASEADLPVDQIDATQPASTGSSALTAEEENDLRFLREEEKLAHDVYLALATRWGVNVFTNIASSEQTHTDAVAGLLRTYGLSDPALGRRQGDFENATLQALHDELVATGSKSLVSALTVGATIEDLDLSDLARLTGRTTKADVLTVYGNLERGSRNHLRSFYGQVTSRGATYAPQYLSAETFSAIVTTPTERGP